MRQAQGGQGIRRLARLADDDEQVLRGKDGVAVAELGGDIDLHGHAAELFDQHAADLAGVGGRAAGGDDHAADAAEHLVREVRLAQVDAAVLDAGADRVAHGAALVIDLLEHEVRVAAALGRVHGPGDLEDLLADGLALHVVDLDAVGKDLGHLPLLEQIDAPRVGQHGRDVGGDVVAALAQADDEGAVLAGGEDAVREARAEHAQGIGALELAHRGAHGAQDVPLGLERLLQQVGKDLGVRLALEAIALGGELFAQGGVVFDDAVVDDRDLPGLGQMRVAVLVRGFAVGSPARVADAHAAGKRRALQLPAQAVELAAGLDDVDLAAAEHRDAGRVVAAVFQAL